MHLKIFIFVTLVALGAAAKQSWKSKSSEKNGEKLWKKGLNSEKKSPLLNINYDYSQKKVPYQRKEVRELESLALGSLEPKCLGILQREARSRGTRVESDLMDLDKKGTRIPVVNVSEDSFGETGPLLLKHSDTDPKKHFEVAKKSNKPAEDSHNEEEWNAVQRKLKDLFNVLTVESLNVPIEARPTVPMKSRPSVPILSRIEASDRTACVAADKEEPTRNTDKLELEDCTRGSYFNLPLKKTLAKPDCYQHSIKGMKCSSDRMPELEPERVDVESLDRELDVHEERSMEISTLSAKLASIEDTLADLRELLLDHVLDEPVSR